MLGKIQRQLCMYTISLAIQCLVKISISQIQRQFLTSFLLFPKDDYTRWFKYDRDYLCVNKSQFVPVIFEPPCIFKLLFLLFLLLRLENVIDSSSFLSNCCSSCVFQFYYAPRVLRLHSMVLNVHKQ